MEVLAELTATARFAVVALFLLPLLEPGRAQGQPNLQLEAMDRSFAAKRAQIVTSVVTPCKDRAEALAGPEEEHEKHCDCFESEAKRQESLSTLHRVTQQALVRCDLIGLDAQIAYIDQREAALRDGLRDMVGKFRAQASAYESWGVDAERGKKEAQDKIGQILIANTAGAMVDDIVDANDELITSRLDDLTKHAESLRDVRRVRTGELKEIVAAMKQELTGKSKAEARQIIVSELNASKLAVDDSADVEKRLAKYIVDASIPRDDEPSAEEKTQSYLEGDYSTLLTAIHVAANHGVKDAKIFATAAGVLAFAPDAIDTAAILYNASAIGDNLSGLDSLRAASEQQRAALSAEFKMLVARRREIETKRSSIAPAVKP